MTTLYKFTAYNSQALYGWGTEAQADAYTEHLNRKREINCYGYREVTDADEIAKAEAGYGDQVDLGEALTDIQDQD